MSGQTATASTTLERSTDRQARFEALAMPLAPSLYATAYRITGNSALAEDLVQEAFALAWQKFDSFTENTNFRAWIFQILVFRGRNIQRKERKEASGTDILEAVVPAPDSGQQVAVISAPAEGWSSLYDLWVDDEFKRALDRLDPQRRTALMLVTLAELSYQECADTMEIPIGTVMSMVHRARQQLQSELKDYARDRGLTGREKGGR